MRCPGRARGASIAPSAKSFLHIRMREKGDAKIAQHGAVDDGQHVGAAGDVARGNVDLEAKAGGVGDGGAVDDAIDARPERVGHAHRARLARGIHCVAGERRTLQLFAGEAHGAQLGVGGRIAFGHDGVDGLHELFAGLRVDDEGTERDRAKRLERASGKAVERAHALFV